MRLAINRGWATQQRNKTIQMNQRIKKFIEQATTVYEPDWNGCERVEDFDKQKFAELLIRDCARIADIAEPWRSGDLMLDYYGIQHDTRQQP